MGFPIRPPAAFQHKSSSATLTFGCLKAAAYSGYTSSYLPFLCELPVFSIPFLLSFFSDFILAASSS
jgi:hypothetical protein